MADVYTLGNVGIEYNCLFNYKKDNGGTALNSNGSSITVDSIEKYKSILIIFGILPDGLTNSSQLPMDVIKNNYNNSQFDFSHYYDENYKLFITCGFTNSNTFVVSSLTLSDSWSQHAKTAGIQYIYGIR